MPLRFRHRSALRRERRRVNRNPAITTVSTTAIRPGMALPVEQEFQETSTCHIGQLGLKVYACILTKLFA